MSGLHEFNQMGFFMLFNKLNIFYIKKKIPIAIFERTLYNITEISARGILCYEEAYCKKRRTVHGMSAVR